MKKLRGTGGPSDAELRLGIDAAIKYLLEKKERDQFLTGDPSFDYGQFLAKLDSAKAALAVAVKHLQRLDADSEMGRLDAHQLCAHRVHEAYEGAMNAMVQVQIATDETKLFHVPVTRSLDLQKSAVRLAHALVDDRVRGRARSIARRILDGAKLNDPHPDESALTRWLQEIRMELQESAVKHAFSLVGDQGDGQVVSVAMKTIDGLRLGAPKSSTVAKWLQEFRTENPNVK